MQHKVSAPPQSWDADAQMAQVGIRAFYETYGFAVLRGLIPEADIARFEAALAREVVPYKGSLLRHHGGYGPNRFSAEGLLTNAIEHPHMLTEHALQGFVRSVRDMVFHPRVANALQEIDGDSTHVLAQTLLFFVCPITRVHIDSFSLDTWPRGQAHTCWIALENIAPEAGPPFIYPAQKDAVQMEFPPGEGRNDANKLYAKALAERLEATKAAPYTPQLKKGDALIWNSLTPHASHPPLRENNISRKSLQVLYWPASKAGGTYLGETANVLLDYNPQFKIRVASYRKDAPLLGVRFFLARFALVRAFGDRLKRLFSRKEYSYA